MLHPVKEMKGVIFLSCMLFRSCHFMNFPLVIAVDWVGGFFFFSSFLPPLGIPERLAALSSRGCLPGNLSGIPVCEEPGCW